MAKTSMKSTALESRVSLHEHGAAAWLGQLTTRYGLPVICVVLVIVFSLTTPSFASLLTLQAILDSKSKIALLALSRAVPDWRPEIMVVVIVSSAFLAHATARVRCWAWGRDVPICGVSAPPVNGGKK